MIDRLITVCLGLVSLSALAVGREVTIQYADRQCQKIISSEQKFDAKKSEIDPIVRAFLEGTSGLQNSERFSIPEAKLQNLYLGHKMKGSAVILRFKEEASALLNGTACQRTIHRQPMEKMLKEIPGVKSVQFEIGGKILKDADA